jgi:hypothetical protein
MDKRVTHIVILVIVAFLVGIFLTNCHLLDYIGGQINNPLSLMFLFILMSCFPLCLVGMVIGILIITLFRRTWSKTLIIICVICSMLIIGMLVGFFCSPFFGGPGAMTFLRGFEKWANRNVDTDAVQDWIVKAPESYWGDPCEPDWKFYQAEEELPKGLPQCFTKFKRQYVIFQRSELDGSRIVRFEWGGGMFHWSLVVGNPDMKMPKLMEERYSDYDVEFRRILKPGVYVYTRD